MKNYVKFKRQEKGDFSFELQKRVNQYFKSNNISKQSDWRMWLKTLIMFSLLFVPYGFILTGTLSAGHVLTMYAIMGIGTAGIGLGVMHDAVHGAYFKSTKLNKLLGVSMNMIGGSALNWKIQHNVLHHTYTNIDGMDDDITPKFILRFSPHSTLKSYHKYQYIYAWFLYSLTTLSWVISKDLVQLKQYNEKGLIEKQGISYGRALFLLILSKTLYVTYMVVLPVFFGGVSGGIIFAGFVLMHLIAGLSMGLIFQPAHLAEEVNFPLPEDNNIEMTWAEHQLYTSANFANKNWFITWFAGGLNYQIEHHLFPNVCHVHYPRISKIVRETASEYSLPYINNETFFGALRSHRETLKYLGNTPQMA